MRKQAKQVEVEARLQKHAELTGRLPSNRRPVNGEEKIIFGGTNNVEDFRVVHLGEAGAVGGQPGDCTELGD